MATFEEILIGPLRGLDAVRKKPVRRSILPGLLIQIYYPFLLEKSGIEAEDEFVPEVVVTPDNDFRRTSLSRSSGSPSDHEWTARWTASPACVCSGNLYCLAVLQVRGHVLLPACSVSRGDVRTRTGRCGPGHPSSRPTLSFHPPCRCREFDLVVRIRADHREKLSRDSWQSRAISGDIRSDGFHSPCCISAILDGLGPKMSPSRLLLEVASFCGFA